MLNLVENQTFIIALLVVGAIANFLAIPTGINNLIKRGLGAAWILLAVYAEFRLFAEGWKKMSAATGAAATQTVAQWIIILIIFTVVMVGFAIHGYYGVTGQYDDAAAE